MQIRKRGRFPRTAWPAGAVGRAAVLFVGSALLPGCFILHRHRNTDLATSVAPGEQPDKILLAKADNEIQHGRYDVGRLTLQTLINTYPDSEYLAKAKLEIADSYYQEGGISGLTEAEAEYKDFITFFPSAPEAPMAQYRAGMAHFRLMGKPDRDLTEARAAEREFTEFLRRYPDSALLIEVAGRLREVQEVVAEGDYETARLYYQRGAVPAALSRFEEIANQYPNFSQADHALWYAGQCLERERKPVEAAVYYARVVTDYPLSPSVRDAKSRLVALHQPVPSPTKAMLARAEADAAAGRHTRHSRFNVLSELEGAMSSAPDFSATRHGPVRLGERPAAPVEQAQANNGTAGVPGTIAVQPLGAGNWKQTQAADPNAANGAKGGTAEPAASAARTPTQQTVSEAAVSPKKKKGKFHFLRKLIPF